MQAVFRKNCIACLNTKRIDQIPICRDDDKERGLTEEKLSALKISEKLSLFHFIEKIYNNTADLVKREVDISLEIIYHINRVRRGLRKQNK